MIRSFRKLVRYFHRIYLDMGFRNEVYPLEWICITSLCFSFPLEYLNSIILIFITFPVAKNAPSMKLNMADFFTVDFSLSYIMLLFVSLPYFLSTLVQVCRKRRDQLVLAQQPLGGSPRRSPRRSDSHMSDDDEDDSR